MAYYLEIYLNDKYLAQGNLCPNITIAILLIFECIAENGLRVQKSITQDYTYFLWDKNNRYVGYAFTCPNESIEE